MEKKRRAAGLSWPGVARAIWAQSASLYDRRSDHPISPATLTAVGKRGDCSCQHALFILRSLGQSPEDFLIGLPGGATSLPAAGSDRRLRWNLRGLFVAFDAERRSCNLTWRALAQELRCTPNQLSGLRRVRFAIGMQLAMRIVTWLGRSARDFIVAAPW